MKQYKDRLSIEGEKILNRIFLRDKSEGGFSLETVGPSGSGKSSLDLHIVTKIMEMYPDEIVFYRDSCESPVQFNRVDDWEIFAEKGITLRFRDYDTNEYFKQPVTCFNSFEDLYNKAKPKQLNVVYFDEDLKWIDFLNFLRRHMHRGSGWKTVVMEEYEDIAPQYASGRWWKKNVFYSKNAKNIRKGLVNTLNNTQAKCDVSFFIRSKLMMRSYLQGAHVDNDSPIIQEAVNKLSVGECLIEFGSRFGLITFLPFYPRRIFEVERIVPVKDEKIKEKDEQEERIQELDYKIKQLEKILKKFDLGPGP